MDYLPIAQEIADMLNALVGHGLSLTAEQVYAMAWAMVKDPGIQDNLMDLVQEIKAEDAHLHAEVVAWGA